MSVIYSKVVSELISAHTDIFGQHKDSEIAKFMDNARGGYFEKATLLEIEFWEMGLKP